MILKADGTKYESTAANDITAASQIHHNNPQGPMTDWFNNYMFRKISGVFYEVLREGIPMIDAAIGRLISFEGLIKPIGNNMAIVKALEDFCRSVPVGDMQSGIQAFHQNMSNEKFEQGFALPEIVATKDLKDIKELRVPDSKHVIFRRNKQGRAEPWYRYPGNSPLERTQYYTTPTGIIEEILTASYGQSVNVNGINEVKLNPANKVYFSMNNENTDPHGVSLMRSMEFCANILVTLENSMKNAGDRFGDPSYHIHLKGAKSGDQTSMEARRGKLETDFNTVIATKRAGQSADLVTAGSADSEVAVKVIGHDGQLFNYIVPMRHVKEQLLAKSGLAAWALGLSWTGGAGNKEIEAELMLSDAKVRGVTMLPGYIKLFSTFLKLRGLSWKSIATSADGPGDWGVVFEIPNIRDILSIANANFLNAQAAMMRGEAGAIEINSGNASVEIGGRKYPTVKIKECGCKSYHGNKELRRTILWPDLDDLENDYESALQGMWGKFEDDVFRIVDLTEEKIKGIDKFIFTAAEKKRIQDALKKILKDKDAVTWHYNKAISLGFISAVYILKQKEENPEGNINSIPAQGSIMAVPLLDILNNRGIAEQIVTAGFELVKENATRQAIDEIIPMLEDYAAAGKNPKEAASALKKKFGDANSDWHRLARSEMSRAAERAKLEEWQAWDIDISRTHMPVDDTHPNCRCSNTFEEIDGKWVAVFIPAPDACPICNALRTGSLVNAYAG